MLNCQTKTLPKTSSAKLDYKAKVFKKNDL